MVKSVHDIKTEEIGPGQFRFKAEVEFCGRMIVEVSAVEEELYTSPVNIVLNK